MQLASTSVPRSATSSATCSYDRGYRRYKRTHKMMSSPGCCRPLNGLSGPIGIDFYPTSSPSAKFATEPLQDVFHFGDIGIIQVGDRPHFFPATASGRGSTGESEWF